MASAFKATEQMAALTILEFLSDLVTASPREQFSRDEVLVLLNCVKNEPDFFDPDLLAAFDQACTEASANEQAH
jgi:hypothetical protein